MMPHNLYGKSTCTPGKKNSTCTCIFYRDEYFLYIFKVNEITEYYSKTIIMHEIPILI